MSDKPSSPRPGKGRQVGYLLGAIVVPLLYVLSAAPTMRLIYGPGVRMPAPGEPELCGFAWLSTPEPALGPAWQTLYSPVLFLAENEPMDSAVTSWFELWNVDSHLRLVVARRFLDRLVAEDATPVGP